MANCAHAFGFCHASLHLQDKLSVKITYWIYLGPADIKESEYAYIL